MNNTVNEESKSATIKTLAIIGLIATIIIGMWLVVQAVRYLPTAFSNLASLLERRESGEVVFSVEAERGVVNSGQEFLVHWTSVSERGVYIFSYECAAGLTAEVRDAGGTQVVGCDTGFWVERSGERGGETLAVTFTATRERYTDVRFTVGFVPQGAGTAAYEKSSIVTVVNTAIPEAGAPTEPEPETPTTPKPPVTGGPGTTPPPTYWTTVPVVTTYYPESDPRGSVDLEVTFLGVSRSANGYFATTNELREGERGYIRFAVKNIGTKTSGSWRFEAELPDEDTSTYRSGSQSALRPGERQIVTLSFDEADDRGTAYVEVEVDASGDIRSSNDSFRERVRIVR